MKRWFTIGLAIAGTTAAIVAGSVTAAHAYIDYDCEQIGQDVSFYTEVPAGWIKVGDLQQEWCPNGANNEEPGSRQAVGVWSFNTGLGAYGSDFTLEAGSVWLENGPNTHTLDSADIVNRPVNHTWVLYSIDRLPYPKTVDAAVHLKYRHYNGTSSHECDLWVAAATHDYSTGKTYDDKPDQVC